MKSVILDTEEVIRLAKFRVKETRWKETGTDDTDAYYNGIADGIDFVLMLLDRCEK